MEAFSFKGLVCQKFLKKGQIIPKRIGHVFVHKKARHLLTFGCDVEINGNVWKAIKNNGTAIIESKLTVRRRNNGTMQEVGVTFRDICFDTSSLVNSHIYLNVYKKVNVIIK